MQIFAGGSNEFSLINYTSTSCVQYFTFFRYEPKVSTPNSEKVEDFTSYCHETVSGWYHDIQNEKWGCFVAAKLVSVIIFCLVNAILIAC